MPEIICPDCSKRMYHENEDTLKIEEAIHKKFCRGAGGENHSYMHRDTENDASIDSERANDLEGKPVIKK